MRITLEQMHAFAHDLEGRVDCMYLDEAEPLGLVTTALGNLIDPIELALHLPWMRAVNGCPTALSRASAAEVAAVWHRVKGMQEHKHKLLPYRSDASLILTDETIDELVLQRLEMNHDILRRRWPDIDTWPLDAELFAHSWAWAVGPNAAYPRMTKCLRARDFEGAAREAKINPNIGSIVTRNARNRVLLTNADRVQRHGLDPQELYWPRELAAEYSGDDPPTAA